MAGSMAPWKLGLDNYVNALPAESKQDDNPLPSGSGASLYHGNAQLTLYIRRRASYRRGMRIKYQFEIRYLGQIELDGQNEQQIRQMFMSLQKPNLIQHTDFGSVQILESCVVVPPDDNP